MLQNIEFLPFQKLLNRDDDGNDNPLIMQFRYLMISVDIDLKRFRGIKTHAVEKHCQEACAKRSGKHCNETLSSVEAFDQCFRSRSDYVEVENEKFSSPPISEVNRRESADPASYS